MANLYDENRLEKQLEQKIKTIIAKSAKNRSYLAEVVRRDGEGTWWVRFPGSSDSTPVVVNNIDERVGDIISVLVDNDAHVTVAEANISNPPLSGSRTKVLVEEGPKDIREFYNTLANADVKADSIIDSSGYVEALLNKSITVSDIRSSHGFIKELETNDVTTDRLTATTAYVTDLTADNITAQDIISDHATVSNLDANYAHISNGVIDNATIGYADVNDLDTNYAHITSGVIDNATIGYADVNDLNANYAHISNGVIDNAAIGYADVNGLSANYAHISNGVIDNAAIGYADVNGLSANYASIDLANVNNAWLQNGTIKNAAISNEMVNSVSANKLTAGTIDASKINVANLQAKNLIVEKLNGQPVLGGYELVSPSSSGYSSKNPKTQGWYEYSNGAWTLSNDTSVIAGKSYYKTGSQVELYDQDYIDGLETTLNQRIDGAVETFTGSDIPTLLNYPVTTWDSSSYSSHVGDIYYVANPTSNSNGYCYRFAYDNSTSTYNWVLIKDSDVTKALSDISDLQEFESDTNSWIEEADGEISTIKSNHTTLSGVVDDALDLIETKVDTTTFNEVKNSVDSNSATITKLTTRVDSVGVGVTDLSSMDIWELGTLSGQQTGYTYAESKSTSTYNLHNSRIRISETLGIQPGKYNVTTASGFHSWFGYFDSDGGYLSNSGWKTESAYTLAVPESTAYYCVVLRLSDNASISSDNVDTVATASKIRIKYSYADSSELSSISNQVSTIEQTIDGIETNIGNLTTAVESKADGSEITTITNSLNSISDTVAGHTQSISSVQSVANSVRTDLDNLSVGGTNLLRGTEHPRSGVDYYQARVSVTTDEVLHAAPVSSYATFRWYSNYLPYSDYGPGVYTVSFDVRLSPDGSENTTQSGGIYFGVTDGTHSTLTASSDRYIRVALTNLTSNWERRAIMVNVPDDFTTGTTDALVGTSYLTVEAYFPGGNASVDFRRIQLERGSIATDYQPAPYDVISRPNLLRGTNQDIAIIPYGDDIDPTGAGRTLLELGRWRVQSGTATNGDAELFEITDFPDSSQLYGIRIWSTTTGNKDVVQGGYFPLVAGEHYTFSCWTRLTPDVEQSSAKFQFRVYRNSTAIKTFTSTRTTTGWFLSKYRFTLTDDQVSDEYPNTMCIGISGKGSLELCGMKIESGNGATPWAPSPFDNPSRSTIDSMGTDISELGTRVTTAETTIASNSEQILLRATKSETYQSAQPNLSPFFSAEYVDGDYWDYTDGMEIDGAIDGWAVNPGLNDVTMVKAQPWVELGKTYTLLLEYKCSFISNYSIDPNYTTETQLQYISGSTPLPSSFSGVGEERVLLSCESSSALSHPNLVDLGFDGSGKIRLSIYEGNYQGPYKPYSGALVYASQAEFKVASNEISSKVSSTDYTGATIASLINQSADSVKIQANHVAIDGTAIFTDSNFQSQLTNNYSTTDQVRAISAQYSRPNLTPFMQYDFGDLSYWHSGDPSISPAANGTIDKLSDGWAHVDFTVDGTNSFYAYPKQQDFLEAGQHYTLLAEIRNHTGADVAVSYTAYKNTAQSNRPQLVRSDDGTSTTYEWIPISANGTGAIYLIYIAISDMDQGDVTQLVRSGLRVSGIASFDVRFSLYEGVYNGPYKPYGGTLIYDSKANSSDLAPTIVGFQRVYYRTKSDTAPTGDYLPTTWVTNSTDTWNENSTTASGWSTKITPVTKDGIVGAQGKYLYLYTCEQRKLIDGTIEHSAVLLDDSATVIYGGNVITGSISANKIAVNDLQAFGATIGGFDIDSDSVHTHGVAATANSDNSIALSSADFTRTIDSTSREGLRFAIGDKFGVTGDGALYASSANVSGEITATSGTIGGAAIQNGVLKVADANITGTISGTKINASQISIGDLSGSIGGRNLLRNTAHVSSSDLVLTRATVSDGIITVTPTTSSAYAKFIVDYLDYDDYGSGSYTVSFDAKAETGTYTSLKGPVVYLGFSPASRISNGFNNTYDHYTSKTSSTALTSEWQHYALTFDVPGDLKTGPAAALTSGSQLSVELYMTAKYAPMSVRNVKLERGTVPTEWTPAPEDIVNAGAAEARNYMSFDSTNGLIVAQSNPSASAYPRVQITSSAVDIKQSSTAYSSVSASGLDVVAEGSNVASFGKTMRIGESDKSYHVTTSNGHYYYQDGSLSYSIVPDGPYSLDSSYLADGGSWLYSLPSGQSMTVTYDVTRRLPPDAMVVMREDPSQTYSSTDPWIGVPYGPLRTGKITFERIVNSGYTTSITVHNGLSYALNTEALAIGEVTNLGPVVVTIGRTNGSHVTIDSDALKFHSSLNDGAVTTLTYSGFSHFVEGEKLFSVGLHDSNHSDLADMEYLNNHGGQGVPYLDFMFGAFTVDDDGVIEGRTQNASVGSIANPYPNGYFDALTLNSNTITSFGSLASKSSVSGSNSLTTVTNTGTISSLAGGATDSATITITIPSGYVAVPLTQQILSNNRTWRHVVGWSVSVSGSTATYNVNIHNASSSTATDVTVSVTAAFVRETVSSS